MPNDLWSYRWATTRALLILPLTILASVSNRFEKKFGDKIEQFITWDY